MSETLPSKPGETGEVPLAAIVLSERFTVREQFKDIGELAETMERDGMLYPLIVRPGHIGPAGEEQKYELVAGHRRFHAAKKLGWKTVRADVRELDDSQAFVVALQENFARRDLNPVEEAEAVHHALQSGYTPKTLAEALGKSEPWISNRNRLRKLPEAVKKLIDEGKVTMGHAEHALMKTDDPGIQVRLAKEIAKRDLNVHDAEQIVVGQIRNQKEAEAWKERVAKWVRPKCPKCGKPASQRNSYGGEIRCEAYHSWDPTKAEDPLAREKRKEERAPKNYEPTEYTIPAGMEEIAAGALAWLKDQKVVGMRIGDGWSGDGVVFYTKNDSLPFTTADEFNDVRKDEATIELVEQFEPDKERVAARKGMEDFLKHYAPKAFKRVPLEGLLGSEVATIACPCGKPLKGHLRALVKCEACGQKTEITKRPREKTEAKPGKKGPRPTGPVRFPQAKVDELAKLYSGHSIGEKGTLQGIFMHEGREYAVVGTRGSGKSGLTELTAQEVVPSSEYEGKTHAHDKPGPPGAGFYTGMRVKFTGQWYVLVGESIEIRARKPGKKERKAGRKKGAAKKAAPAKKKAKKKGRK